MKKLLLILVLTFTLNAAFSQSIAVSMINTYKVKVDPSTASAFVRLELIKLGKYSVLDRFDMAEVSDPEKYDECFAKTCLTEYGRLLKVDYLVSGSIDKISNKIVVSLKLLDIKSGELIKNATHEFNDQEAEMQRMVGIVVKKLHAQESDPELVRQLSFNNEVITSSNRNTLRNSGPRIGVAYAYGTLGEFLTRNESYGGFDIFPVVSVLGYQFEAQYVGTENFSALFEFVPLVLGLEQGKFIPTIGILNGFRFGKAGWEIAFGPSFGLSKTSTGFFDTNDDGSGNNQGAFGELGRYWTQAGLEADGQDPEGYIEEGYHLEKHLDSGGDLVVSTRWVIAFGRTFTSGALNVPVNIFHSSQKGGGMFGVSVGFNVTRSKK